MANRSGQSGSSNRFYFLEPKITADGDCSLKSREITLPAKVSIVKAIVFLVVMYRCESWTIKKAKQQRMDAFELWCWRRRFRVPGLQGDKTRQY